MDATVFKHFDDPVCTVTSYAFLIAGDDEADGSFVGRMDCDEITGGDDHGGDWGFHVGRTVSVKATVPYGGGERIGCPFCGRIGGLDVGMAGEDSQWDLSTVLCPEVGDAVGLDGFTHSHAVIGAVQQEFPDDIGISGNESETHARDFGQGGEHDKARVAVPFQCHDGTGRVGRRTGIKQFRFRPDVFRDAIIVAGEVEGRIGIDEIRFGSPLKGRRLHNLVKRVRADHDAVFCRIENGLGQGEHGFPRTECQQDLGGGIRGGNGVASGQSVGNGFPKSGNSQCRRIP